MYIGDDTSNQTAVVLIPYWIAEAIRRAGLSLKDCVDYEKIKPILSTHDMATFLAFQRHLATLIGPAKGFDFGEQAQYGYELEMLFCRYTESWAPDTGSSRRGWHLPSKDYVQVSNLSYDQSFAQDISARLYGADAKLDRYDHAYDLVNDIAPNVVGVIVYPGYFSTITDKGLQLDLVQGLLKVFYGNGASFHEVAALALFKRHLELLSLAK